MTDNKYDESLLLLLELADKYIDASKIGKIPKKKQETEEDIESSSIETENKVRAKAAANVFKISPEESKVKGEDAEYMFSLLVGEHFATDEDIKSSIEEVKKRQEEKKKKEELSEEEKKNMKKTQELIKNNYKNNENSLEKEKEDLATLLEIMDIYMDIYKP